MVRHPEHPARGGVLRRVHCRRAIQPAQHGRDDRGARLRQSDRRLGTPDRCAPPPRLHAPGKRGPRHPQRAQWRERPGQDPRQIARRRAQGAHGRHGAACGEVARLQARRPLRRRPRGSRDWPSRIRRGKRVRRLRAWWLPRGVRCAARLPAGRHLGVGRENLPRRRPSGGGRLHAAARRRDHRHARRRSKIRAGPGQAHPRKPGVLCGWSQDRERGLRARRRRRQVRRQRLRATHHGLSQAGRRQGVPRVGPHRGAPAQRGNRGHVRASPRRRMGARRRLCGASAEGRDQRPARFFEWRR